MRPVVRPGGRAAGNPSTLPVVLLIAALVALAACGAPSSPSASAPATGAPTTNPPAIGSPASPAASPAVAVDTTLLRVLPADVDGITVVEAPDALADVLADPELAKVADRVVAAIAIEPTGQFVYAVVVGLRGSSLGDAAFRDWRDSFDEGACSQAGGVGGNAQAVTAGRTVYIGTCAGGLHTYHVLIVERGLLVSASAAGDRRLGELLVGGLRP